VLAMVMATPSSTKAIAMPKTILLSFMIFFLYSVLTRWTSMFAALYRL
jgi:hypothetical protein